MAEFRSVINLSVLNGHNGLQINGKARVDDSGGSVAASDSDINGDGFDDSDGVRHGDVGLHSLALPGALPVLETATISHVPGGVHVLANGLRADLADQRNRHCGSAIGGDCDGLMARRDWRGRKQGEGR